MRSSTTAIRDELPGLQRGILDPRAHQRARVPEAAMLVVGVTCSARDCWPWTKTHVPTRAVLPSADSATSPDGPSPPAQVPSLLPCCVQTPLVRVNIQAGGRRTPAHTFFLGSRRRAGRPRRAGGQVGVRSNAS
jgi:hypothetical protein